MSSISELAKEVAQNMSAKTDQKIEVAKETVIQEVRTEVVKEVIHDELNVDLSGLATQEYVDNSIPDVSIYAEKESTYTKLDTNELLNDKANKTDLDNLATKQELEESKYDDTEIKNSLSEKASLDDLSLKADKTDLDEKVNQTELENYVTKADTYTKDEVINLLAEKANLDEVFKKVDTYSAEKIQELLDLEANKDTVYTISQVDNLLLEKANTSDIPDISGLATKQEVEEAKYDDTEVKSSINELTEDIAEVINGKAEKSDLFKNGVFNVGWKDNDESTHSITLESPDFGGIFAYNAPKNIKSYIGLNKSDESGIDGQIYAINPDTRIGTRINFDAEKGVFYSKNTTNRGLMAEDELATKGDIPDVSDFVTNAQLNLKADKSEIPDISHLADKTEVNAVQTNIDALTLAVDSELDKKVDISTLNDYATKEYADSKEYDDTDIKAQISGMLINIDNKVDKSNFNDFNENVINNKADKNDVTNLTNNIETNYATKEYADSKTYDDTEIKSNVTNLQNTKADKTEIPDVSGFANQSDLTDFVNNVETNYATKTYADSKEYDDTEIKTQINEILNTKVDLDDLTNYATKDYADSKEYDDTEVRNELANKANKTELVGLASEEFVTNSISGKVDVSTLDNYATKEYADSKEYDDTEIRGILSEKADKNEIPDVSEFITENEVDSKIGAIEIPSIEGLASEEYVNNAVSEKANVSDIPDISELASIEYVDSHAYDDTQVKNDITDLSTNKVNKDELFRNDIFYVKQTDVDNSYNIFWQEKNSGGGNQYYNSITNTLSYIGVNKNSGYNNDGRSKDIDIQLYSKDKTSNIGTRLNITSKEGIFYTKNTTSQHNFDADREIAVLGDLVDFYKKNEVDDALAEKANMSDIPDISTLADTSYVDQQDNDIKDLVNTKLDANKVWNSTGNYFETTNTLNDGSYAKSWNENSGGGVQVWTQPKNTLSFVGVNHWSDGDLVAAQIYTKDKTTNIGVRMSFNPTLGAFYSKEVTGGNNNNFAPGREIAVKDDINALLSKIKELEQRIQALENN